MKPTRAAVAAIHNNTKGELSGLIEKLESGEVGEDEGTQEFSRLTAAGVWEALYILAEAVDDLRDK